MGTRFQCFLFKDFPSVFVLPKEVQQRLALLHLRFTSKVSLSCELFTLAVCSSGYRENASSGGFWTISEHGRTVHTGAQQNSCITTGPSAWPSESIQYSVVFLVLVTVHNSAELVVVSRKPEPSNNSTLASVVVFPSRVTMEWIWLCARIERIIPRDWR